MVTGLSDHNLTLVARKLTSKRFSPYAREYESLRIPRNKMDNFKSALQQIDWDDLLLGIDYEQDSQIFSKKVGSIIQQFNCKFRHKNNKNSVPWINADIFLTSFGKKVRILTFSAKADHSGSTGYVLGSPQGLHPFPSISHNLDDSLAAFCYYHKR